MDRAFKFKAWDMNCMCGPQGLLFKEATEWLNNLTSNAVLLQFTGLKDKNGKEIYEGDVVYIAGHGYCLIVWDMYDLSWKFQHILTENLLSFQDVIGDIESIKGNSFENPELLKEQAE